MNKTCLQVLLLNFIFLAVRGQATDSTIVTKKYFTKHLLQNITIDGVPNEAGWNVVPWGGDFIQRQPYEGKPPTQPTNFKIVYDDKFLYVAYRCHELTPDSILKRMGRRDEFPGDWVEINIDSYHDLRTAFSFTLSASGVRSDEFISNDGYNWDANWNPIWIAKTHIDENGWTAEVKIPFSQLRYNNDQEKIWGIQVTRRILRKEERSTWQNIPQSAGVWVSRFGELHGLKDIPIHRQVEIAPYVILQADKYPEEAGNPFAKGLDGKITGGVDGKVAITNDLILDFTVNPDFGQVEADPSQVRIDGFQNFFEERRPFFMESRNIFDYQLTGAETGGDFNADLLFYSRRIGGSPHGYPEVKSGDYVKYPLYTSILGAAKFSGKTKKGWSIGILESITAREMATIDNDGERRKEMVEPLTNYFVGRLQKDSRSGNTILGGIITSVNREKGMDDILHSNANSGGLDFLHYWKNRTWYIRGNMVFSHVQGSRTAILNTQLAFEHLFQRLDATEVDVDSSRNSLTGMGGTVRFGKIGGKTNNKGQVLKFETGLTFRSPQFELNDIGFLLTTNEINHFTWVGWQFQQPFSIFRNAQLNYNHWSRWDYSGQFLFQAFNFNSHATFKNNWQAGTGLTWNPYDVSNNALRGAFSVRRVAGFGHSFYVRSDSRKKFIADVSAYNFFGDGNVMDFNDFVLTLSFQPIDALRFSLSGSYTRNWRSKDQFVSLANYNNTTRAIVGEVKQETIRYTGRFSYNITPDLTIQYYGQPYITRPLYDHYAYVSAPMAKSYHDRFTEYKSNEISLSNNEYIIDENADGIPDYKFYKPDFNFVQFRSNLILRWEYRPGSELYFVWSQGNTPPDAAQDLDSPIHQSLFDNAFAGQARNSFLVKVMYRFLK